MNASMSWISRFSSFVIPFLVSALPTAVAAEQSRGAPPFPQPEPGDVFREFRWTNVQGDAGGALRVGGRVGYDGSGIALPQEFDLSHATRAEVVVEKLLCHDGTRGLAISVNDHPWIDVPEAAGIPQPAWEYQHHTYPVAPVPLAQLRPGKGNQFRMRVSDKHPWNWPQHLIYGVHFRIYYDAALKAHPVGRLTSPQAGAVLGDQAQLRIEASSPNGAIHRVDYVGRYEDVNFEGDGVYRQWHYRYRRGDLLSSIGAATAAPWRITWDTSWVPDQPRPFQLAAWVTDETGLIYVTESVKGLTLNRVDTSVELCKPYDVPTKWVTRSGEKTEKFRITGDLTDAIAAQLVWVSWSPGYLHGIRINGREVFQREGPKYDYYAHRVTLDDPSVFRRGENELTTGLTPKYDGKTVHGAEINWPGIMVLIRYKRPPE